LEQERLSEKEERILGEGPLPIEEPAEKNLDLSKFEMALQSELETGGREVELEPFSFEIPKKEIPEETLSIEDSVEEEELKELPEEEFQEGLLEEILSEEEIGFVEEPIKVKPEEAGIEEIPSETLKMEKLEEFETPKIFGEETVTLEREVSGEMERVTPLIKVVDKHLEEVIAKGVRDMAGDFITKILPEMTQHIIGLTADRIEKMVKEIIPELAEKAIQEEIKRLKKGEKD
jgi:hypothetical protein